MVSAASAPLRRSLATSWVASFRAAVRSSTAWISARRSTSSSTARSSTGEICASASRRSIPVRSCSTPSRRSRRSCMLVLRDAGQERAKSAARVGDRADVDGPFRDLHAVDDELREDQLGIGIPAGDLGLDDDDIAILLEDNRLVVYIARPWRGRHLGEAVVDLEEADAADADLGFRDE